MRSSETQVLFCLDSLSALFHCTIDLLLADVCCACVLFPDNLHDVDDLVGHHGASNAHRPTHVPAAISQNDHEDLFSSIFLTLSAHTSQDWAFENKGDFPGPHPTLLFTLRKGCHVLVPVILSPGPSISKRNLDQNYLDFEEKMFFCYPRSNRSCWLCPGSLP